MRIALFGPTGGTGRAAVEQALAAGHDVVAFARRPERIGIDHDRLRAVAGDAFDAGAVAAAIAGCDAVITTLGTRPWKHSKVCSAGTADVIAGMQQHGVRRLVVVSSFGVGDSRAQMPLAWRLRSVVIGRELADKDVMERAVAASGLDWIVARPVILTGGRATGRWRAADDGSIRRGFVRRADVAAFALAQLDRD